MISFILLVYIDEECNHFNYANDGYVDVFQLVGREITRLKYVQFMTALLAVSFFYTSYSYFAYSLTKVSNDIICDESALSVCDRMTAGFGHVDVVV